MKISLEFDSYSDMILYCQEVIGVDIKQESNKKSTEQSVQKSCNDDVTGTANQIKSPWFESLVSLVPRYNPDDDDLSLRNSVFEKKNAITNIKLGDYVVIQEVKKQTKNKTYYCDQLYQYVVAPDGKRGLLRASCLDDRCFDKNGSNVYAKSTLKKFVDQWAAKQDFDAFAAEISLLELPSGDWDDATQNRDYVLSLKLSEDLGWFWTKTASSTGASHVWYVDARASSNLVYPDYTSNGNGVPPALWLKSDIELFIVSGSGTKEEPYKVEIKI